MSLIARLPSGNSKGRIKIYINENDHPPPHLHMYCKDGAFKIELASCEIKAIWGNSAKARVDIKAVVEWMHLNMDQLILRWAEKERGEKVSPII
jgi:hypothetical protein